MSASQGPLDDGGPAGGAGHSEPVDAPAAPVADFFEPILAACAPIADVDGALDAERAVSALLGGAYAAADTGRDGAVERFAEQLVSVLRGRSDALSGALLAGLSGVAPGGAAARAAEALSEGAGDDFRPVWASAVGRVHLTGSWVMSDVFGDQAEYVLAFEYEDGALGGPPHAVCVLADFNLGAVKDCWTALQPDQVLEACRRSAESDEDLLLAEVDAADAADTVRELFAGTDGMAELPDSQALPEERSVALARLATLPPGPARADDGRDDRSADALVDDFLTSPEGTVSGAEREVVEACVRLVAEYSVANNRPDRLRWSPVTVEAFLTDWVPRAAVIDEECVRWLPTVLAAFVTYAGRVSDRPERAVAATQEAVMAHVTTFAESMFGGDGDSTVQVARQLIAEGVDPTDPQAVRDWLETRLRGS